MIFIGLIIMLSLGTVFLIFWNFLLFTAAYEHEKELAAFALRRHREKYVELELKYYYIKEKLGQLEGLELHWFKLRNNTKSIEKKAIKIKGYIEKLEEGNYNGINFLALPGFSLLQRFNITGDQPFFLKILKLFADLKGREFAVHNTRYLLANMISIAIGGGGLITVLGVLFYANGNNGLGLSLSFGGLGLAVLLSFALYEDLKSKSTKRKKEIISDFAQAVTELALLTSSGMEVFNAWNEICRPKERTSALFREMRQTSAEINNGFNPAIALDGFIKRCGTQDTTRLGTSILQNLTRGNDALSEFLAELAADVWLERKNTAKKLGEEARSKLMLPMVIIFFGIILLIGVPIFMGMSNMGF
ncbi:MAG: type II secretion system F family protein [Defluviitaleaceae bacterium]|nr:type II secretion system F family protein [Defluviitaleaceae bacterium]